VLTLRGSPRGRIGDGRPLPSRIDAQARMADVGARRMHQRVGRHGAIGQAIHAARQAAHRGIESPAGAHGSGSRQGQHLEQFGRHGLRPLARGSVQPRQGTAGVVVAEQALEPLHLVECRPDDAVGLRMLRLGQIDRDPGSHQGAAGWCGLGCGRSQRRQHDQRLSGHGGGQADHHAAAGG
jgi:hypothetical protein